jgi:holliday junction DNA helicase RuvA
VIASLHGPVLSASAGHVVVSVGGVGLRVEVVASCALSSRVGADITLFTQLIVREDSLTLFGFEEHDELEMFNLLTSVSGVGPRSGLGILAELRPADIAAAVKREDDKPFRQVQGIGPKTAKLIVVSLAGKIDAFGHGVNADEHVMLSSGSSSSTIVQALVGLGWAEASAHDAVVSAQRAGADMSEQELLRASLILLQNTSGRR